MPFLLAIVHVGLLLGIVAGIAFSVGFALALTVLCVLLLAFLFLWHRSSSRAESSESVMGKMGAILFLMPLVVSFLIGLWLCAGAIALFGIGPVFSGIDLSHISNWVFRH